MAKKKKIPVEGNPIDPADKPKYAQTPQYHEKSKEEFNEFARKRVLTAVIKSLETIEENFGDLWKHFSKEKKSKEELRYLHKWLNARKFILEYAHDQMDYVTEELELYDVGRKWFNVHIDGRE